MSFAIPTMKPFLNRKVSSASAASTLLLHFDGTNGQTTTTDSSANNVAITINSYSGSTAGLSTSSQKFGTASFANLGQYGYVTFPNTLFNFGSSDFTIDFWWNPQSEPTTNTGVIPMHHLNSNFDVTNQMVVPGISMRRNSRLSNNIMLIMSQDGTTTPISGVFHPDGIFEGPPLATPWQHIALERYGSLLTFYVNGVGQTVSGALTGNIYYNSSNPFAFGGAYANIGNTALLSTAYYDELRIVKGTAMYGGSNFTPSTSAYTS